MDRRTFVTSSVGALLASRLPLPNILRHRDRLRIGVIGVGGRGASNLAAVADEAIVALCDVDDRPLRSAKERFSDAKTYRDYREMIERGGLDAVVISTPDHSHAPAAARALRAGLHVYCEKPLTHTVAEARHLTRLAAERGLVTQMGIQIHAEPNYRRVVDLIRSGVLGPVHTAHVFCSKSWSGGDRPDESRPVPAELNWDLWLGPAAVRPYHEAYHPAGWRSYFEFGGGTLGDMGCHYLDLAHWALGLTVPMRIAAEGPPPNAEGAPKWLHVRYEHAARAGRGPVTVTWSDGGHRPAALAEHGVADYTDGVLFLGERGHLVANYHQFRVKPEALDAVVAAVPERPQPSPGHHREWLDACRNGRPQDTTCGFSYSGPLTETVLLGVIAHRSGRALEFDAQDLTIADSGRAQRLLEKDYREGFRL